MKYLFGAFFFVCCLTVFGQKKLARPDVPGELMVDIGLNFWDEVGSNMNQKAWQSKAVTISYSKNASVSDRFRFLYGLGISFDKVGFSNNRWIPYLFQEETNTYEFTEIILEDRSLHPNKYRLSTTHIEVPLELRYHPRKTEAGEGFFVGAGVIGGILVKASDKSVFDVNGDKKKNKDIGITGLSNFRYGFQFRVGFRGIHLFCKYYLSNFFTSGVRTTSFLRDPFDDDVVNNLTPLVDESFFNPRMTTIGINVTGF